MPTYGDRLSFHPDHSGATTPAAREAAYRAYVAASENYNTAIRAAGDTPWFEREPDPEAARRALFMRRYTRPAAPRSVTYKSLPEIRAEHTEWK